MTWGLKNKASKFALLAAFGVLAGGATSATAADLGGDCCADLEERIAELEATTARKGNRKVSLEVSGHVNEALLFWDDGEESNVYVVGNDTSRSRFRFKGKAKISADWEAGYLLEVGVRSARSDRVDQGEPGPGTLVGDDPGGAFDIRHSSWFIKSKTYGSITVGETPNAAEAITEINLSQTNGVANLADVEDYYAGFRLRNGAGSNGVTGLSALRYGDLFGDTDADVPGEGDRGNYIRYETPEFAGFTASAAYGEDDEWSAALRYKGEFNGIKIAAGVAYTENTEETNGSNAESDCATSSATDAAGRGAHCRQVGGSISLMHVPTGLFLSGAAGWAEDENANLLLAAANTEDDTSEFYAVQGGLERKFVELGKTTIYGEYFRYDGGTVDATADAPINAGVTGTARILGSEVEMLGIGVVQGIDAASMRIYASYRHFETELTVGNNAGTVRDSELDDLDVVMTGAIINF